MTSSSTDQQTPGSQASVAAERRREERFSVPVDVELMVPDGYSDVPEIAVLRNISNHGVGLIHQRALRIGDVVTCVLLDSPADDRHEYRVEIVWQQRASNGTYHSGGRIV